MEPGVNHEFDAAECTLDWLVRLQSTQPASGKFKLCTEAAYIALKRPKPCLQRRFGQRNRNSTPLLVQESTFVAVFATF
jgi:hypothetical protein